MRRRPGNALQLVAIVALAAIVITAAPAGASGPEASPDGPEAIQVYYTLDDALAHVFGDEAEVWPQPWSLSQEDRDAVEMRLGRRLAADRYVFHRARRDGQDLGWAVVLEEKGRFKPITFLVHVNPDHEVENVVIMIYRESRGDAVKRGRFLNQFRGKSANDRLRLDRDVMAVSGATMSSRALAAGVKRALVLVDRRYGESDGS